MSTIYRRVMTAVGDTDWGRPDGVPESRTLYYGTHHIRSQNGGKGTLQRFSAFDREALTDGQYRDAYLFTGNNDGSELWFGTPHEWHTHLDSKDVRRLFWYLIFEWYGRARWFGLRRPIYYWALRQHLKPLHKANAEHRRKMKAATGD